MNRTARAAGASLLAAFALSACAAGPTPTEPTGDIGNTYEAFTAPEQAAGYTGSSCTVVENVDVPYATTDAVISGAHPVESFDVATALVHSIGEDAPLYSAADDSFERIGTMPAVMPWETDSAPIVSVAENAECGMSLVLIPARAELPSVAAEPSSQAAAWLPTELLEGEGREPSVIEISLSEQTVTLTGPDDLVISTSGITPGSADEPTPTGPSYVVSQYEDAEHQPWTEGHPILLLSSHSIANDSLAGNAGEIGIHYHPEQGNGSAGCIRIHDSLAILLLAKNATPGDLVIVAE